MSTLLPKIATGTAFWLPLTVGLYCIAREAHRRAGKTPLLNPTLLTIAGICAALFALQVPHAVYFESVSVLHYLLGTAVVALAVPLYRNLERLARAAWPTLLALVAGSLTSILAGLFISAFSRSTSS
jgi:putative effector of murein hydrolase